MPYLASLRDLIVLPSDFRIEFDRDDDLECPHCEREMVFKKCDARADHFAHTPDSVDQSSNTGGGGGVGGCEHAGESETHELMKKSALTQLKNGDYPSFSSVELEKEIAGKKADVAGVFEEPHSKYGDGICVEVQYRNTSKDYIDTTLTYLQNGFSPCWVFYDDWEMLFHAKHSLRTVFSERIHLGHTESPGDIDNLGEPITPNTEYYAHINPEIEDPLQFFVSWNAYTGELAGRGKVEEWQQPDFPKLLLKKMVEFLQQYPPFNTDSPVTVYTSPKECANIIANYVSYASIDHGLDTHTSPHNKRVLIKQIESETEVRIDASENDLKNASVTELLLEQVVNEHSQTAQRLEEEASETGPEYGFNENYWRISDNMYSSAVAENIQKMGNCSD